MRIILITLLFAALGGCAFAPSSDPAYFILILPPESDSTQYVMLERGKQKSFHFAHSLEVSLWWPFPFYPADGSMSGEVLFTRRVYWWDMPAAWEIAGGSDRHRRLGVLRQIAMGMSPPSYWLHGVEQEQTPRRWILSAEPMVLAIGTDVAPVSWYHRTYSIPETKDLDRTATELVILDKWPGKNEHWDVNEQKAFETLLAQRVRRQKFPAPLTLREILATRPWQEANSG